MGLDILWQFGIKGEKKLFLTKNPLRFGSGKHDLIICWHWKHDI